MYIVCVSVFSKEGFAGRGVRGRGRAMPTSSTKPQPRFTKRCAKFRQHVFTKIIYLHEPLHKQPAIFCERGFVKGGGGWGLLFVAPWLRDSAWSQSSHSSPGTVMRLATRAPSHTHAHPFYWAEGIWPSIFHPTNCYKPFRLTGL